MLQNHPLWFILPKKGGVIAIKHGIRPGDRTDCDHDKGVTGMKFKHSPLLALFAILMLVLSACGGATMRWLAWRGSP
jgi:hypothetical protein